MIKLSKLPAPVVLESNWLTWTQVLVEKREQHIEPSQADLNRYNRSDVKNCLIEETGGKCAYCESKFSHVTFGDIEHIVPKVLDDTMRYRWSNLTIACDVCNTRKGRHVGVVDPYVDEPSDYLGFIGDIVFPRDQEGLGYRTLTVFDLNRSSLRERRYERIRYVESLIATYERAFGTDMAQVILADVKANELTKEGEYAAAVRNYLAIRAPEFLEGE